MGGGDNNEDSSWLPCAVPINPPWVDVLLQLLRTYMIFSQTRRRLYVPHPTLVQGDTGKQTAARHLDTRTVGSIHG